jgi:methionyl-tRNA synthetase
VVPALTGTAMATFYITTAIDYVNARPHIGHAFEKIGADAIARHRRLKGFDVMFLIGTDENSLNAEREAKRQGLDTQEYCDRMAAQFQAIWKRLAISNDDFIRTTEPRHKQAAQQFFKLVQDRGDIYKGTYEGWYCVSCEAFYSEDELKEGLCPVHGTRPEWIKEENYFFALSRYQDRLLKHYEEHPEFIQPDFRRNEVINMVRGGLKDFSVSRASMRWGIPVPGDPGQVIYVWFDALLNYISAIGYGSDEEKFRKYWPADVHIIGKDIVRFHCIYWPAMLMSAGLPLPKQVFGHGFVYLKGEKISKTRGNIVDPGQMVDEYGADAVRYYLLREIPFERDGDFDWESFERRYNAELANDLGNLLNRTVSMIARYFGGSVPAPGPTEPTDDDLRQTAQHAIAVTDTMLERFAFSEALNGTWQLVARANKYIDETQPWVLARDPAQRARLGTVLYNAAEAVRLIALLVAPIMPDAADRMLVQLGLPAVQGAAWVNELSWGRLQPGGHVQPGGPLFPRLEHSG